MKIGMVINHAQDFDSGFIPTYPAMRELALAAVPALAAAERGSNPNYCGPDSFTYTISDGNGGTDAATVTITIHGVTDNTPPVAEDDDVTTDEDTALLIDVLADNGHGAGLVSDGRQDLLGARLSAGVVVQGEQDRLSLDGRLAHQHFGRK